LKWAQSIDGYIDHKRATDEPPAKFSTQLGTTLVHRIRSIHDAITVGTGTIAADRPRLDTRYWPGGQSPIKALNDCSYSLPDYGNAIILHEDTVESYLNQLYKHGITSLLVEGGAKLLQSFINNNLWDDIRIEISPYKLSEHGSIKAPTLPINNFAQQPTMIEQIEHNKVLHYTNLTIGGVKNL
jgi:diaminohydroxyphosphoribosylaminopyrimidine deaminase/5-amino-6-(5-phosphoribosylamino)uracil reductase